MMVSAPIAWCRSLAPRVSSCTDRSASTGSVSVVGSRTNIAETLLPLTFSDSCTDTGRVAISGLSGTPPWSRSHSRIASPQAVSTTSLTVQP